MSIGVVIFYVKIIIYGTYFINIKLTLDQYQTNSKSFALFSFAFDIQKQYL